MNKVYKIKEFLSVVFFSGLIGLLVCIPFVVYFGGDWGSFLNYGSRSILLGTLIGIASTIVYAFVYKIINHHPVWSFISVILTIGIGTVLGAYFIIGIYDILSLIVMLAIAETLGIILTAITYSKSRRYNEKLKEYQENQSIHKRSEKDG